MYWPTASGELIDKEIPQRLTAWPAVTSSGRLMAQLSTGSAPKHDVRCVLVEHQPGDSDIMVSNGMFLLAVLRYSTLRLAAFSLWMYLPRRRAGK